MTGGNIAIQHSITFAFFFMRGKVTDKGTVHKWRHDVIIFRLYQDPPLSLPSLMSSYRMSLITFCSVQAPPAPVSSCHHLLLIIYRRWALLSRWQKLKLYAWSSYFAFLNVFWVIHKSSSEAPFHSILWLWAVLPILCEDTVAFCCWWFFIFFCFDNWKIHTACPLHVVPVCLCS